MDTGNLCYIEKNGVCLKCGDPGEGYLMIVASAVKFYKVGDIKYQFTQIKTGYYHNIIHNEIFR